jgi:hypothetical protein
MQKAVGLMNLKLTKVLGDGTGVTGPMIIRAIAGDERDPQRLAKLRDRRCPHTTAEVATALDGRSRPEHVTELKLNLARGEHYPSGLAELDHLIAGQYRLHAHGGGGVCRPGG